MSGYIWAPRLRWVPTDGTPEILDLPTALTDMSGPTRVDLRYVPEMGRGESINRRSNIPRFGFRPEVDLECDVITMADQATIADMVNRAMRSDGELLLSLDGGLVERAVDLTRFDGPRAIGGKTFAGASFVVGFRCKDLISEIPDMMTDPGIGRELLPDGGFELWTAATNLQAWTEGVGATGSWNQEGTTKRTGTYSARGTKTASETLYLSSNSSTSRMAPGLWYRWDGYVRADATISNVFRLLIRNLRTLKYVSTDGTTWQDAAVYCLSSGGDASGWTQATINLKASTDALPDDAYSVTVDYGSSSGVNQNVYWDDFSLFGPILRSGYATW